MHAFKYLKQMQSIPVTDQSFYRVGIDLVGPVPTNASGKKYIIVAMDYLTKWPEVQAPTKLRGPLPTSSMTTSLPGMAAPELS